MAEIAQALQTIEHVKTDFSQPVNLSAITPPYRAALRHHRAGKINSRLHLAS
jgi:hypothetical protein